MQPQNNSSPPRPVRCAIYTRKSTEEGLEQGFNSLDAQREAAEAYILSQRQEGWAVLPHIYNDGGFTGANMGRPALAKLMTDIEAGRVDCVVVYKVDRLSRSLLDFARIMGTFEKHGVSFVSVTQQFNTSVPVGRLTLNILLSFAQFEREIISERTRDKKSAARKKGKWTGGYLPLGYDLDPRGGRLVVNESEARRVITIFELFAETRSLAGTLEHVRRRGWGGKSWMTQAGKQHAGGPFNEGSLVRLLSNELYAGSIPYQGKLYRGEHRAIVETHLWKRVHRILSKLPKPQPKERNKTGALLKGMLQCSGCGKAMAVTGTRTADRRYRYYVCRSRQSKGSRSCPRHYVAAEAIENSVIEQLRKRHPTTAGIRKLVQAYTAKGESPSAAELVPVLRSVVETVAYEGTTGQVTIRLRASKERCRVQPKP